MKGVPWEKIEEVKGGLEGLGKLNLKEDLARISGEIKEVKSYTAEAAKGLKLKMARREGSAGSEKEETERSWIEVVRGRGRRRGPQVVVEFPRDREKKGKKELVECLDSKGGEVRIVGMRRAGRSMILEVHDDTDLEKLRGSVKLTEAGFKVDGKPRLRKPKIIIRGVEKEIGRKDLLEAVNRRNPVVFMGIPEEEREKAFVSELELGRGSPTTRVWVVRVDERVFTRMMKLKKVYVGMWACRVEEYLVPVRCFKCLRYGHHQVWCSATVTCVRCGKEGHWAGKCTAAAQAYANCIRGGGKDVNHSVNWKGCPVLEKEEQRLRRMTSYVYEEEQVRRGEIQEKKKEEDEDKMEVVEGSQEKKDGE